MPAYLGCCAPADPCREELGRIVDCDLSDPGFWGAGLDIVESQLLAALEAGREAGPHSADKAARRRLQHPRDLDLDP
ncbi:MAG: hypothetical protein R2716_11095 [Microthrixaceae bacterium]